jgi:ABC-type nitrate/sulfonate/bicarbonate transport system substrate-binding protein
MRRKLPYALLGFVAVMGLLDSLGLASADDTRLRVKVFPGPQNLALFAARERGFFAKRRFSVELQFTTNS